MASTKNKLKGLFGEDHWKLVGRQLRGASARWWDAHREDLIDIAAEELEDVLRALRNGDTFRAKMEIVGRMSREEWLAYRDATTKELKGIAARRAAIIEALEELGTRAARIIGTAAAKALGL